MATSPLQKYSLWGLDNLTSVGATVGVYKIIHLDIYFYTLNENIYIFSQPSLTSKKLIIDFPTWQKRDYSLWVCQKFWFTQKHCIFCINRQLPKGRKSYPVPQHTLKQNSCIVDQSETKYNGFRGSLSSTGSLVYKPIYCVLCSHGATMQNLRPIINNLPHFCLPDPKCSHHKFYKDGASCLMVVQIQFNVIVS